MSSNRSKYRPIVEALEGRLALSGVLIGPPGGTTHSPVPSPGGGVPPPVIQPVLPAPVNRTLVVLTEFARAYESHPGEANYNPALDLNHNNQIAQVDGKLLLRALPPLRAKVPLQLTVSLSPEDQVRGHHPANSGGVTYNRTSLVVGHTVPGALIFTGIGTLDLKIRGPVVIADARGNFAFRMTQTDGINQLNLLVFDAYGQQTLRAFPIVWQGFGAYEAAHPRND